MVYQYLQVAMQSAKKHLRELCTLMLLKNKDFTGKSETVF